MELRPYQKAAKEAVLKEWQEGNKKTLIVAATGTGKTIILSAITREQVAKGHRVLIMAHRGELLTQAAEKLEKSTGLTCALEKADSTCLGASDPVVVGSVQSLAQEKRLSQFPSDYFQDIIVDEAHHCLTDTYQRVLAHFPNANVLGVTATPDRGDMRSLGRYFDSLAYEYGLRTAITEGYLAPIKAQMIPLKLDIRDVAITSGDYNAGQLGSTLEPYLGEIVNQMKKYCQGRKTMVFLPLVKTSQEMCRLLNEAGFSAVEVHGTSKDRTEVIKDFSDGKYNVITNSMLLTEGFDCPDVDCIICLRPTRSRALYQQIIGRGSRLAEGKKDLLILDFLWMTAKHDLCKATSVLCSDEEIVSRMEKRVKSGETVDILEAEAQAKEDVVKEREAALAAKLAALKRRKARFVDPLQYYVSIGEADRTGYEPTFKWELKKPSAAQLGMLENCGIETANIKTKGEASQIISAIMERRRLGLSSPKQIHLLERYGFEHVGTWSFKRASSYIDQISKNNWRLPAALKKETVPVAKEKIDLSNEAEIEFA